MKTIDALNVHLANASRRWMQPFGIAIFILAACFFSDGRGLAPGELRHRPGTAQDTAQQAAGEGTTARIRVAQGDYKVLTENGIGPFEPAVYDFSESWILWRLPDGSFEVSGTRTYNSPADEPHSDKFSVHLSSDFSVLSLTEFRKLRWRSDSGPLTCSFLAGKMACTSNAKDAAQNVSLNLPLDHPFGLMWPISAFSLGGITRSASRDPRVLTAVDFVRLEEASRADPIMATVLSGHLKYLGEEQLRLAGQPWRADKFELKVPLHAPFLLWTSPKGLLLAFSPESKHKTSPGDGLALVRFQQWSEF